MGDIVQIPESQSALTQKPDKPTSIKILQWLFSILTVLSLISLIMNVLIYEAFSGEPLTPQVWGPYFVSFLLFFVTSVGLVLFNRVLMRLSLIALLLFWIILVPIQIPNVLDEITQQSYATEFIISVSLYLVIVSLFFAIPGYFILKATRSI